MAISAAESSKHFLGKMWAKMSSYCGNLTPSPIPWVISDFKLNLQGNTQVDVFHHQNYWYPAICNLLRVGV